jgi:hypothetical protein
MEGELWKQMYHILTELGKGYRRKHQVYSDVWVVAVYLWAVLHDRPTSWACDDRNWPESLVAALPSPSRMSRRLRTNSVNDLLKELEMKCRDQLPSGIWKWIDAKPLPIGNCSKDRQAGYGRCASGMGKGYKFYAVCDSNGAFDAWRIASMNKDERVMAARLFRQINGGGYITGDSIYDSSQLYATARQSGFQLVAVKHRGGLGHQKHRPERLRSIELSGHSFGANLLNNRRGIELCFAHLTFGAAALQPLPAWVRTHRRVELWVRGKIIIRYIRKIKNARLTA